jgi:hypothetical protein
MKTFKKKSLTKVARSRNDKKKAKKAHLYLKKKVKPHVFFFQFPIRFLTKDRTQHFSALMVQ